MKDRKEIIEEVKSDYAYSIKNGEISVSDKIERVYSQTGEYMGAWVETYIFVDDADEEGEEPNPEREGQDRYIADQEHMDRKEAFAALLFDSEHWDEDNERPSEEACHKLAEEIIRFVDGD